jgi:hypothetical protein
VPPAPDIRLVRTDIAGFFGFTERGPVVDPNASDPGKRVAAAVKVTSWTDFRNVFGGFLRNGYLAYAVRGFFATGGTTCYVARVAAATSPASTAAMPLPAAVTTPVVTHIAAAVSVGQSQIKLDSSDVVSAGDLIAIGDPNLGECLGVVSVIDDQTISVAPTPISDHAVGDPVYLVSGSLLSSAAQIGDTTIQVVQPGVFHDQDLIVIAGGGLSEVRVLMGKPSGSSLHLSRGLGFAYPTGATVRQYPGAFIVSALSAGAWGNRIQLEFIPVQPGDAVTRFSLRVTVGQGDDPAQPPQEEFYPLLSLDPTDPPSTQLATVVNAESEIIVINQPGQGTTGSTLLMNSGPLATGVIYLQGGSDGNQAGSVTTQDFRNALDVLGLVDEIGILCCPDAVGPPALPPANPTAPMPPAPNPCASGSTTTAAPTVAQKTGTPAPGWSSGAIQEAMIAQCAVLQYRVAVLDTPMSPQATTTPAPSVSMQPSQAIQWLVNQPFPPQYAKFAAVYYPWLQVPDELALQGPNRTVPPSGHIAGAYSYTDNLYGVQKPPANVELQFVSDVDLAVTNQQQGLLNVAGINAIRPFPGRGIRVWGARSISKDPDWRYIHTRRLMSMIEESVEKASQWLVFHPNNNDLRRMLTHSLNVFLQAIWLNGGLAGDRVQDSYFVKCDATNNPQSAIDNGILVCQVGVAIAAPAEFLVFQMNRSVAGAQVVEA